jgi:hypothetical protein
MAEHVIGCDHGAEFRAKRAMRMTLYQWNGERYTPTWAGDIHVGSRFHAPSDHDLIYVGEFI